VQHNVLSFELQERDMLPLKRKRYSSEHSTEVNAGKTELSDTSKLINNAPNLGYMIIFLYSVVDKMRWL